MARIVTDYLENASRSYAEKTAFVDKKESITFSELRTEAMHIAAGIICCGFFKRPVAIYLNKSVHCVSTMFGVAYSGNFYTVIDTEMPSARIEKIFATLEPELIITDEEHRDYIADTFQIKTLVIEELVKESIQEDAILEIAGKVTEADVLYVLFTSGSTGIPKGVITSQRAVMSYLDAVTDAYHLDSSTIIGNQAPFYFVLSLIDIYCTIKNGGTTYIIPTDYFMFPGQLMRYIAKHQMTLLNWVSSALSLVANLRAFDKIDISCVKTVIFGGEVMPVKHLNAWMDALPETVFINGYGSTEVTDSATYFIVNRRLKETDLLPLGIPLGNTSVLVLNEKNEIAGHDEIGELCVRGTNLSYGYYNDIERTEKVFVQNPLVTEYKEIIYKTGDLVRYNEYNEIEYIGRKDFQIKHMGYRIELGEIEVNISSVSGVDENCCLYDSENKKIVLFYSGAIEEDDLLEKLQALLPKYMQPGVCNRVAKMPHNLNGKIDRAKLKESLQQG